MGPDMIIYVENLKVTAWLPGGLYVRGCIREVSGLHLYTLDMEGRNRNSVT